MQAPAPIGRRQIEQLERAIECALETVRPTLLVRANGAIDLTADIPAAPSATAYAIARRQAMGARRTLSSAVNQRADDPPNLRLNRRILDTT
jgi:hypothetical protein